MPNWFVYDAKGGKHGPISSEQLKALANAGKINGETIIEADSGQKGKAGQIKGLIPSATPSPSVPTQAAAGNGAFCTSCGSPISPQAVACMKCGADPKVHQNFCRQCGVPISPNQVVCVKCGSPVASTASNSMGSGSVSQTNTSVFCTNCGNSVSEQAVACMKCGADPTSQKNFCRQCGAQLNPNQVVCVKCGAAIGKQSTSKGIRSSKVRSSGHDIGSGEKSRVVAAALALVLGQIGVHWFYLGNTKWALIHLLCVFPGLIFVLPALLSLAKGVYDGITFLKMSDEEFQEVYCSGKDFPKFFGI